MNDRLAVDASLIRERRSRLTMHSTATATLLLVPLVMAVLMPNIPAKAQSPVATSSIAGDERIDFFTTGAMLSDNGAHWIVPIHGRVYRPVRSTLRRGSLAALLKRAYGIAPVGEDRLRLDSRLNLLLSDNKGGRRIVIELAGNSYMLPVSAGDGHVTARLTVPVADLDRVTTAGRAMFKARLVPRDPRTFSGTVLMVPPEGRSVISDIDDTIKITHVTNRARLMEATFAKEFEAVPGMAKVYQGWTASGVTIHYVSSTPWHLYRPMTEFLEVAGFPPATVTLKQIRLKDSSIANLLADATTTKPPGIEAILQAYPRRTFVLVGDSGEKDPEIYAGFMRRYPQRIERILIRNVTGAKAGDARLAAAFAGLDPARWHLFDDASELPQALVTVMTR